MLASEPHLLIVVIEATDEAVDGSVYCLPGLLSFLLEGQCLFLGCSVRYIHCYAAHVAVVIPGDDGLFVLCLVYGQVDEMVISQLRRTLLPS